MFITRSSILLSTLTLLALGSAQTQAQVLLNGSFESPAGAPNSSQSGAGTDWTASGHGVQVFTNDYADFGNTPYGSQ